MSFKGFENPNFTQIPNDYLDYTISPECDLSPLEMRIMNFFFRETYGWQEKTAQLVASVTDFQSLFNIQKRKSITDALDKLTNERNFLQSIQVKQLPEKTKKNISKIIKRTLHPAQKLYRLNLIEHKNRSWDNIRNWENEETKELKQEFLFIQKEKLESKKSNGYQEVPINGYQEVPINGYQEVPINGYQEVPIKRVETLDNKGENATLNKGLNKDLNKVLNKNTYLSEIEESLLPVSLKKVLVNRVGRLVSDNIKFEEIEDNYFSNNSIVNINEYNKTLRYCLENTRGRINNFSSLMDVYITKHLEMKSSRVSEAEKSNKKNNKPVRVEYIPEYFNESNVENEESSLEDAEIAKKRRELEERIKKL